MADGQAADGHVADGHGGGAVLEVVVVSPASQLYQGQAEWVTAPGAAGQLGILPKHADLVTALGAGPLRIGRGAGGETVQFWVKGGFLKVGKDRVTVLVDRALTETEIDENEARQARQDLAETLATLQHPKSDQEFAALQEQRAWSDIRIRLAGK